MPVSLPYKLARFGTQKIEDLVINGASAYSDWPIPLEGVFTYWANPHPLYQGNAHSWPSFAFLNDSTLIQRMDDSVTFPKLLKAFVDLEPVGGNTLYPYNKEWADNHGGVAPSGSDFRTDEWQTSFMNYACERLDFIRTTEFASTTPIGIWLNNDASSGWFNANSAIAAQQPLSPDGLHTGMFTNVDFIAVPCYKTNPAAAQATWEHYTTQRITDMVAAVANFDLPVIAAINYQYNSDGTMIPGENFLAIMATARDAGASSIGIATFFNEPEAVASGLSLARWQQTQQWTDWVPADIDAAITAFHQGKLTI